MPILDILLKGGVQAHKAKGFGNGHERGSVMGSKGIGTWDARGRWYNQIRWDHGGGQVGL